MIGRLALPSMGVALLNLAALGAMIGWVGASRAFSVGLDTLVRDHLPAVLITMAATVLAAFALGRRLHAPRDVLAVIAFAIAADVAAAVGVTLVIDEMRGAAEFALPRALFTDTVGGLQLLAIAAGAAVGSYVGRARPGIPQRS